MKLHLIYHFQSSYTLDEHFRPARYKVLYCFTDDQLIGIDELKELAKTVPDADFNDVSFLSLDELKQFTNRVMQHLELNTAVLLSAQDYNVAIDTILKRSQFIDLFDSYGEIIKLDIQVTKKKLLGKIFT